MKIPTKILDRLAQYLQQELRKELTTQPYTVGGKTYTGHRSTGNLEKSIKVGVRRVLDGLKIEGKALSYVDYVEDGRKTKKKGVPLEALIRWMRQKKMSLNGRSELSVAFAIQHSIRKRGIPPSRFIRDTEKRTHQHVTDSLDDFCAQMADNALQSLLHKFDKRWR